MANLGAKAALDAATRLEEMGRDGDLTAAEEAFEAVESEIGRLKGELAPLEMQRVP